MILGIVGAEAKKFTPYTEEAARRIIRALIQQTRATEVVSGHSPLGGIDWWAIEEAKKLGVKTTEYPPGVFQWRGHHSVDGFYERNMKIARASDIVVCIAVQKLPEDYAGMEFPNGCYHCHTPPEDHIKSGGCWTARRAVRLGKKGGVLVIDNEGIVVESRPMEHSR